MGITDSSISTRGKEESRVEERLPPKYGQTFALTSFYINYVHVTDPVTTLQATLEDAYLGLSWRHLPVCCPSTPSPPPTCIGGGRRPLARPVSFMYRYQEARDCPFQHLLEAAISKRIEPTNNRCLIDLRHPHPLHTETRRWGMYVCLVHRPGKGDIQYESRGGRVILNGRLSPPLSVAVETFGWKFHRLSSYRHFGTVFSAWTHLSTCFDFSPGEP